jgi:hypothetical protein
MRVTALEWPGRVIVLVAAPPLCGPGVAHPARIRTSAPTTARAAINPNVLEMLKTETLSCTTDRFGRLRTTTNSECCIPWMQPLLKITQRRSFAVPGLYCVFISFRF